MNRRLLLESLLKKTELPISDLTGTKWLFNSTVNVNPLFNYEINFKSNNTNFTNLVTGYITNGLTYLFFYPTNQDPGDPDDEVNVYLNSSWINEAYRTIEITGGDEVINTALINWLLQNATQIPIFNNITVGIDLTLVNNEVYYRLNNGNWTLISQRETTLNNVEKLEFYKNIDNPIIAIAVNDVRVDDVTTDIDNPTDITEYLTNNAYVYLYDND